MYKHTVPILLITFTVALSACAQSLPIDNAGTDTSTLSEDQTNEKDTAHKNKSPYAIRITEPEITSEVIPPTYKTDQERLVFKGDVAGDVEKITVNFENRDENLYENYTISSYKPGDRTWEYVADVKYYNIASGTNMYTFTAFAGDLTSKARTEIVVEANIPDRVLNTQDNNEIVVSYKNPFETIDPATLLTSIGKYEQAKELHKNDTENYDETFDQTLARYSIKYFADVTEGDYAGSKVLLLGTPCFGMCLSNNYYRVLQRPDDTFVLLNVLSQGYVRPTDKKIFDFFYDEQSTLQGLFPEDQIVLSAYDSTVYRDKTLYFDTEPLQDIGESIGQDFYVNKTDNCLLKDNADGTHSRYFFNLTFLHDSVAEEDYPKIKKGEINTTWEDGTTTSAYYTFGSPSGCGRTNCYDVVTPGEDNLGELIESGTTDMGQIVYEEFYSDEELTEMAQWLEGDKNTYREQINSRALSSQYESFWEENKPSFLDFAKMHPILYIKDPLGQIVKFTNEKYLTAAECAKPVIYLYPEVETDVFVEVEPTGGFTVTEPAYNDGWFVHATTESELYNYADETTYPYLFWEGKSMQYEIPEEGFVIQQENVADFLNEKLTILGLNDVEKADFMEYWVPHMTTYEYYFITFVPQYEFDYMAPLSVSPAPDTIIRVFMDFKGLDEYIEVPEQQLFAPAREGFTVVEWGGESRDNQ